MFVYEDYENILKTTYRISNVNVKQSKEGLKTDILHILSEQLQYHHLLFWEVVEGELNDTPIRLNVEEYTLTDYLSTYKYYDPLHPINMHEQPTIQLMGKNTKVTSRKRDYYQDYFLGENNYKDEMVMYLKNEGVPSAAIGFLRKREELNFTQRDVLTLCYIKQSIENMYLLHQYVKPEQSFVLTAREEEVLFYICKGCKNYEIAQQLFVSENTIKKHLQNLYRKFKVSSRTQLAMVYMKGEISNDSCVFMP